MAEIKIDDIKDYLLRREKSRALLKQGERERIISDLKALAVLWRKYRLDRVYLYGSFADMTFHKSSDIDLAIEPAIGFEDLLKLYSEMNRHFKQEVDVRLLQELPFSEKVKREGVVVYERENSHSEK
ncbi:MAG: nucleotidyltransferase domain-containing protein [bacterium]